MKFRIFRLFPLVALVLSGCAGYQLGDVKPSVYAGIDSLHVPPFKNLTLEPRLSSLVTNAVITELQADGTYKVATKNNCDAVLVGTIREVRKRQLRAVRTDTLRSQELSLYLYVDFHLEHPGTGARIEGQVGSAKLRVSGSGGEKDSEEAETVGARQGTVVGETIQYVDRNYQVGERNALSVAAEDVADKLVAQLANGW